MTGERDRFLPRPAVDSPLFSNPVGNEDVFSKVGKAVTEVEGAHTKTKRIRFPLDRVYSSVGNLMQEDKAADHEAASEAVSPSVYPEAYAHQWSRLLAPALKYHGHVVMDVCAADGALHRTVLAKSFPVKMAYRHARKAQWGDLWPVPLRPTRREREIAAGRVPMSAQERAERARLVEQGGIEENADEAEYDDEDEEEMDEKDVRAVEEEDEEDEEERLMREMNPKERKKARRLERSASDLVDLASGRSPATTDEQASPGKHKKRSKKADKRAVALFRMLQLKEMEAASARDSAADADHDEEGEREKGERLGAEMIRFFEAEARDEMNTTVSDRILAKIRDKRETEKNPGGGASSGGGSKKSRRERNWDITPEDMAEMKHEMEAFDRLTPAELEEAVAPPLQPRSTTGTPRSDSGASTKRFPAKGEMHHTSSDSRRSGTGGKKQEKKQGSGDDERKHHRSTPTDYEPPQPKATTFVPVSKFMGGRRRARQAIEEQKMETKIRTSLPREVDIT